MKVALKRGTRAGVWAAAGIDTSQDAHSAPAALPVRVRFAGFVYGITVPVWYSARAGVGGRFSN